MGRLEGDATIIGQEVSAVGPNNQHKEDQTMAVLPSGDSVREQFPRPEAITLQPNSDPVR